MKESSWAVSASCASSATLYCLLPEDARESIDTEVAGGLSVADVMFFKPHTTTWRISSILTCRACRALSPLTCVLYYVLLRPHTSSLIHKHTESVSPILSSSHPRSLTLSRAHALSRTSKNLLRAGTLSFNC